METPMTTAETILTYWFGANCDGFVSENEKLWWTKSDETDAYIRDTFGDDIARASAGEHDDWRNEPRSSLALVILLDQFSRNVHRNTGEAFAYDAKARQIVFDAVERGFDDKLRPVERSFLYMPLMHSESVADHARSIELFDRLRNDVPSEHREKYDGSHNYAVIHADIVKRFGRYPHRNELLGRETTDEEAAFLKEPNSSF